MSRNKKTPAGWRAQADMSDEGRPVVALVVDDGGKRGLAVLQYSNGWRCAHCWQRVGGVIGWMPEREAIRRLGTVEALPAKPDVYEGAVADLARRCRAGKGR